MTTRLILATILILLGGIGVTHVDQLNGRLHDLGEPVAKLVLGEGVQDGRIDVGMKLLRSDWSKWKRAEKIFSEISPVGSQSDLVEDFPGINVGRSSRASSNDDA